MDFVTRMHTLRKYSHMPKDAKQQLTQVYQRDIFFWKSNWSYYCRLPSTVELSEWLKIIATRELAEIPSKLPSRNNQVKGESQSIQTEKSNNSSSFRSTKINSQTQIDVASSAISIQKIDHKDDFIVRRGVCVHWQWVIQPKRTLY